MPPAPAAGPVAAPAAVPLAASAAATTQRRKILVVSEETRLKVERIKALQELEIALADAAPPYPDDDDHEKHEEHKERLKRHHRRNKTGMRIAFDLFKVTFE